MMLLSEMYTADPTGGLLIAVGAALLARFLYKPRNEQPLKDDKPTTATQRGAFLPLVIGTRQVGAVVMWVGDREIFLEDAPVGGKGGGGGGDTAKQSIYWEKAIHGLCVGPAARIKGIYVDGDLIPGSTNLNSLNTPSGSLVDFGDDVGVARFFWGEIDQPISPWVSSQWGIGTRLPYTCRVEWVSKRLGPSPRWPIIEYVVEVPNMQSGGPVATPTLASGINVATAFWQLVTAEYPHGAGLSADWWDFAAITALGALSESEEIGTNILVQDGETADRIIAELMQDFGFLIAEDAGVMAPFPLRKYTDVVPLLDDDILLPPAEEIETVHKSKLGDALVYEYHDETLKFRTATIDVDDDSLSAIRNQRKTKKIPLPTITNRNAASKVVSRRQIEDLDKPLRVKLKGLRELRYVQPGQPLDLPGVGRVRVLSTKPDMNGPSIELDLVRDMFDQDIIEFTDPDIPGSTPAGDLEPHIHFEPIELPLLASPSQILVAMPHIRDNPSIYLSNLWASADGLTYSIVGTQSAPATGGILAEDFTVEFGRPFFEQGPLVTTNPGDDRDNIPQNLESVPDQWVSGSQIMYIIDPDTGESEVFYIRDFIAESGNNYRAIGCFTRRLASRTAQAVFSQYSGARTIVTYPAGSEVYIMQSTNVSPASGGIVATGGAKFFKAQPVNDQGGYPLGAIAAVERPIVGRAITTPDIPWAVCGGIHNANPGIGSRRDGAFSSDLAVQEDLLLEWLWLDSTNGAGQKGFGQATPISIPPDASFEIKVRYGTSPDNLYDPKDPIDPEIPVVATYSVAATDAWNSDKHVFEWAYTRAQRLTDGVNDMNWVYAGDNLPSTDQFDLGQIEIRMVKGGMPSINPVRLRPIAQTSSNLFGE